ncbi:MAG: glycosyltransferase [Coriobacteriia bacterium]|nr:glycosyltransferase [Coriobacteriia bacterium]
MKVLFLENLPYESDVRVGSHHYASRFARDGHEVFWLSHPISPLHFLRRTRRDVPQRVRAWRDGPLEAEGVLWYSPFVVVPPADAPILRSRAVYRGVRWLSLPPLAGELVRAGFATPDVVWLTNPYYESLAESLRVRVRAVRIADDAASFAGASPAVKQAERRLLERADVVFAASVRLCERLSSTRPDAVWLPNGVEPDLFGAMAPEPPEYQGVPRPRIVYVGAQEYWFDADLVAECARALPTAAFFLIGPAVPRVSAAVAGLPNVRVLGPRKYGDLPGYLQHADLGIVPFIRDEMVDSVHPIKVYEYLASGLSVVCVRWAEVELMQAPIRLADRRGFCRAVEEELHAPSFSREARLAYAAANTWESRYSVVKARIEEALLRGR